MSTKISTITEDTTLDYTYSIVLVDTTDNDITITLPPAESSNGVQYTIKKIANANNMILDGNDSETIDGNTTFNVSSYWISLTIACNGTEWYIIVSYLPI